MADAQRPTIAHELKALERKREALMAFHGMVIRELICVRARAAGRAATIRRLLDENRELGAENRLLRDRLGKFLEWTLD